jgi:hypothetical protein
VKKADIISVFLLSLIIVTAISLVYTGSTQTIASIQRQTKADELLQEKLAMRKAERDKTIRQNKKWAEKDKKLKEELKEYYVPLPVCKPHKPEPPEVKGIYVTGNMAGSTDHFNHLVDLLDSSELNTMVIDVKDDNGLMTYKSNIQIINDVEANSDVRIKDIHSFMNNLDGHNIYPIARIVTFKDRNLSAHRSDLSIQKKTGGIWRDHKGISWVNPYDKRVWDYDIAVAKEAALNGFKEIQFDYVRFPENGARVDAEAFFPGKDRKSKEDCIADFLTYAREQLKDYNVIISADVFGLTTSVSDDMDIGQSWKKISPEVEYISPMIYPSHYTAGNYGFSNPNAHPYEVVDGAVKDALKKDKNIKKSAVIRPWIQDFSLGQPRYSGQDVLKQIKALKNNGINGYLLWNAGNKYSEDVLR